MNPLLFIKKLYEWHATIDRKLPWKDSSDPYKIWLSEIIMQQTRVQQGESYYLHFIEKYPSIVDLAHASEDTIMKSWQGLGYYSRARNLHRTAKLIVQEHNGVFPSDFATLLSLPGIGSYTAAAIASFAFQKPYAVVDGNVIRVLCRILGIESPYDTSIGKKIIEAQAQKYLDQKNPAAYNQAIMDFGALHCKPQNPACGTCVFMKNCIAQLQHKQDLLPLKSKSIKIEKRFIHFFVLIQAHSKKIWLRKRTQKDIWQGLYEFPAIYHTEKLLKKQKTAFWKTLRVQEVPMLEKLTQKKLHKLSHQELHIQFEVYCIKESTIAEYQIFDFKEIKNLALPKPLADFWTATEKSID